MKFKTDIDNILSNHDFFLESKKHIEDETNLFMVDFLGFPWYKVAIERMLNLGSSVLPEEGYDERQRSIRLNDFHKKKSLLNAHFEYAFFTKSRQYRRDKSQKENHIFIDIYKRLKSNNTPFIIFDIPDNSNFYDTRYFKSIFYKQTIPYEHVISLSSPQEQNTIRDLMDVFSKKISILFAKTKIKDKYSPFCRLLFQSYNTLAKNIIPNLYTYKKILHGMKIKCLFGAMGTHDLSGIDNNFCICEVGHGVGKRNNYTNSRLVSYYQSKFYIEKMFYLELNVSNKIYKENENVQFPFLKENTFNFGMPEIRNYKKIKHKIMSLRNNYATDDRKFILILTAAGTFNDDIKQLINTIKDRTPNSFILLRQHPRYDVKIDMDQANDVAFVNDLNLFDCICMADVIISPPNNTSHEASFFSDHVIVYPHRNDVDFNTLRHIYQKKLPFIDIKNTEDILKEIQEMIASQQDSSSDPTSIHDTAGISLDMLFSKIEEVMRGSL